LKKESYKFIYQVFFKSKNSFGNVLFLILISILGAFVEIGFLSTINIILQPENDKLIFSNLIFILILLTSIFFGLFKIYIMRICGRIIALTSQSIYLNSFISSLNKSLIIWSGEESSFITKNTISNYRIVNGIFVPITSAIPPFIVSIFLSMYLIYKYPLLVLISVLCVALYYFAIIKILSPLLTRRSKIINNQDKRMKALLTFSFRDKFNLFFNGSFQNIFSKYDRGNNEVRKAEAETIIFNSIPRSMLEVAVYVVVVFAYYILIFNNPSADKNNITPGELATILICFFRLAGIANQIYNTIAAVSINSSQLEELINSKKFVNIFNKKTNQGEIEIPNKSILRITGKSCYFKIPFNILDEIRISSGEITTIEGESGIGKTTFCNLLMLSKFITKTDDYSKFELEDNISFEDDKKYLGSLFCLNSQNLLVDGITAYEFLESANPSKRNEISRVLQNLFGKDMVISITEKRKKLTELSGGEFQRLLIARTIISNAKFVFLDETTSGLDNANELKSIELLIQENIGILIISHKGIAKKYAKNRYKLCKLEKQINIESV
tara:strand:+ start:5627 stop:7294 length:1668 start_codon:yes stop_codon:yes gene_type:complete